MDGYKHYIRIDANNIVIDGYVDWQEDRRQPDELCILEDGPRAFHEAWPEPLTNVRGQLMFLWVYGQRTERDQADLDLEWAARPPAPKSTVEEVADLKAENAELKRRAAVTEDVANATSADLQALMEYVVNPT